MRNFWLFMAFLVTVVFGLTRVGSIEQAPPIELTPFNLFKDAAHLWVGGLIGGAAWTSCKEERTALVFMAVTVTLVETIAAAVTFFK